MTAGGGIARCDYVFETGGGALRAQLRLQLLPGPPLRAELRAAVADGDVVPAGLKNYAQRPAQWDDDTSVLVTLQAWDSNEMGPEGLRMWLDVDNCWLDRRVVYLDANGEATLPSRWRSLNPVRTVS